jgi:hypothetical protein
MDPPEIRYAKSGEVRIAYQVIGGGDLDLVWVPGFVTNLELAWEDPAEARHELRGLPEEVHLYTVLAEG